MNVFQQPYEVRLQTWYDLRNQIDPLDTQRKCIEIDKWWQQAPLVNHYLHPADIRNWPSPWELLVENNYCQIARGLGMCYTLLLTGTFNLDFLLGKDDNDEDVAIITVEGAKYMLNYYPDSVISSNLNKFKVTSKLDLTEIIKKLG